MIAALSLVVADIATVRVLVWVQLVVGLIETLGASMSHGLPISTSSVTLLV
jgi:hypothetical protein